MVEVGLVVLLLLLLLLPGSARCKSARVESEGRRVYASTRALTWFLMPATCFQLFHPDCYKYIGGKMMLLCTAMMVMLISY